MTKQNDNTNTQSQALAQLMKDLGMNTLPQDKQNELLIKMTEVLLKRIFIETMDKLGEKGREEYMKMTEEGKEVTPEQVEAFFKEKIKNYDGMIKGVIEEFKEEMMTTDSKQSTIAAPEQNAGVNQPASDGQQAPAGGQQLPNDNQ
ncbi:MAG TPA: DUF5663 domain-containing protein [Candidatus Moranbacteria bacterium]|jgi:ABC-type transporter MlaC component|nr:hypothetical protein [Candidatus Moranbacteria bacterium]HOF42537.1 DUF5663 domain-containing protein [Candidatus Moranbacteria bacterium]HPX93947.1 DUF5663 domain-containing protein [Candidatus Moranbacteria bacterium]HQB59326.1 DUF5663 domain-containing protein [Candidatus Moranbacteria bacterium]